MATDHPDPPHPRDVLARFALDGPDADVAELAAMVLVARIADLPEQGVADLHAAVLAERHRRLHTPEVFPPASRQTLPDPTEREAPR